MLQPIRKSCQFGTQTLTLETGRIARQADGAVLVTLGDVTVLATVVGRKEADPNAGFFPLTVEYQEKTYAAGRIPGGFFRREGRPTEKETLTARLIDRPIRPLFPKGFMNEVQVICSVLSASSDQDPDIAALIGSSAALAISGIPFDGPIGAARVGMIDGEFVLNPDRNMLDSSKLDMVVAGTATAVLMVESEADQLSEAQMLDAVLYAHNHYQAAIALINELAEAAAKPRWSFVSPEHDTTLHTAMLAQFSDKMQAICDIREKMPRYSAFDAVVQEAIVTLATDESGAVDTEKAKAIHAIAEEIKSNIMRTRILNGQPRIDGRDTKTVRNLSIETGVLDRVHGSALFTRGETQALVVTTLGAERDAQLLDTLEGVYNDNFMFHYNFPPFCVGETGRVGSPKRREIGHGRLARRGVTAVMPDLDSFGYTVRVVSEITESNGSSSMASVCGASLSMMDAGIPLKAPVAGVAMGLIKEGDTFAVLTDIIGDEDHLGDMDFKVAGTQNGVTALQMDIKIQGITADIMRTALAEALAARLHILTAMNAVLDAPRQTVSPNAPIRYVHRINKEKKRDLIGKGGETVKSIQERTGSTLDIKEDGQVIIFANNKATLDATIEAINAVVCEPEVGAIYPGKVVRVEAYGAFIEILPGQKGLLHVSEMADTRVENVHDYVQEGQTIDVRLINIDEKGRLRLSRKGM